MCRPRCRGRFGDPVALHAAVFGDHGESEPHDCQMPERASEAAAARCRPPSAAHDAASSRRGARGASVLTATRVVELALAAHRLQAVGAPPGRRPRVDVHGRPQGPGRGDRRRQVDLSRALHARGGRRTTPSTSPTRARSSAPSSTGRSSSTTRARRSPPAHAQGGRDGVRGGARAASSSARRAARARTSRRCRARRRRSARRSSASGAPT